MAKIISRRKIGPINLSLRRGQGGYLIRIRRADPAGGAPFDQEYWVEDLANARDIFSHIRGEDDVRYWHDQTDLPPLEEVPGGHLFTK